MACLTCCNLFAFSTLIIQSEPHNHYVPHCRAITVNSPFVSKYFSEYFVFYSYILYCNNVFFIYSATYKGYLYIYSKPDLWPLYIQCQELSHAPKSLTVARLTPSFWTFTNTLPRQSSQCAFFLEKGSNGHDLQQLHPLRTVL